MGKKTKFSISTYSPEKYSGRSSVKCKTCKRIITNAQLRYSLRVYKKPLCRGCQSLESYRHR